MRSTPVTRRAVGIVLMLVLLTSALGPLVARAGAVASPVPTETAAGSLAAMLGRLPDRPLGLDGAMVTYADLAQQTAALGVDAPRGAGDEEGVQRWIAAVLPLSLPQATGQYWALPEWRAAFGFDLYQIEQAVEYGAPPFGLTVLRGALGARRIRRDQAARSWVDQWSLKSSTRTAATVCAPVSLQRMPGPFWRTPIRCLQAASTMPEPMSQPAARYWW